MILVIYQEALKNLIQCVQSSKVQSPSLKVGKCVCEIHFYQINLKLNTILAKNCKYFSKVSFKS